MKAKRGSVWAPTTRSGSISPPASIPTRVLTEQQKHPSSTCGHLLHNWTVKVSPLAKDLIVHGSFGGSDFWHWWLLSIMIHRNLQNGLLEHNQSPAILSSGSGITIQPSVNSTTLMPNFFSPRHRTRPPTAEETSLRLAWLGYRQELSRNWGFWSSFSLSYINLGRFWVLQSSAQLLRLPDVTLLHFSLSGATSGTFWAYQTFYILGGPVSVFWGSILIGTVMLIQYMVSQSTGIRVSLRNLNWCFVLKFLKVLAELASAYPAAGAMFTW
jgi:hypothetical protein